MRKTTTMAHSQPPPSDRYRPCYLAPSPGADPQDSIPDQAIEARIATVTYATPPGTTMTICTVILDTGYVVRGACTGSGDGTFDPALGERCAYREALWKLRTLFGFLAVECRYLYAANTTHLRRGEL
jgi:hypothetical protein